MGRYVTSVGAGSAWSVSAGRYGLAVFGSSFGLVEVGTARQGGAEWAERARDGSSEWTGAAEHGLSGSGGPACLMVCDGLTWTGLDCRTGGGRGGLDLVWFVKRVRHGVFWPVLGRRRGLGQVGGVRSVGAARAGLEGVGSSPRVGLGRSGSSFGLAVAGLVRDGPSTGDRLGKAWAGRSGWRVQGGNGMSGWSGTGGSEPEWPVRLAGIGKGRVGQDCRQGKGGRGGAWDVGVGWSDLSRCRVACHAGQVGAGGGWHVGVARQAAVRVGWKRHVRLEWFVVARPGGSAVVPIRYLRIDLVQLLGAVHVGDGLVRANLAAHLSEEAHPPLVVKAKIRGAVVVHQDPFWSAAGGSPRFLSRARW